MPSPHCLVASTSAALLVGLAIASSAHLEKGENVPRMRYRCPPIYKRIGNGCYYFSDERLTWHEAQYACQDLGNGYLAQPDRRWKDRSLKRYLNRSEGVRLERWLGTIFDGNKWMWGVGGEKLRYQGFSRRKPDDNYNWRCGVFDPTMFFRWGTRSCIEKKSYVCEVPIKLVVSGPHGSVRKLNRRRRPKNKHGHTSMRPFPDIDTNRIT